MKILQVGSFHYHAPWFAAVSEVVRAGRCDAIAVTGNMCDMTLPMESRAPQCVAIRNWISRLRVPVFYGRGWYDPAGIEDWSLDNLHLAGAHDYNLDGWRIHVRNTHEGGVQVGPSTVPTIIVSHFPPRLTRTALDPHGTDAGVLSIRGAAEVAGDCRLILCGHVLDPLATTDYCDGAFVVNPGLAYHEHTGDPAHAFIDCDRREVRVYDGRRIVVRSFARDLP